MKKLSVFFAFIILSISASAQKANFKTFDFFLGKREMKTKTGKLLSDSKNIATA